MHIHSGLISAQKHRSCPQLLSLSLKYTNTLVVVLIAIIILLIGVDFVNHGEQISPQSQRLANNDHIGKEAFLNSSLPLPSCPKPFVGRKSIADNIIQSLLSMGTRISVKIVVIFGPPSLGKSSLAIHVGHEIMNKKKISVHYVDLSEFQLSLDQQTKSRSAHSKIDSFDSTLSKTVNGENLLKWAFKIKKYSILVLDNCDSVFEIWNEDFQKFVLDLRKASHDNLRVIITSQTKLSFPDYFNAVEITQLSRNESLSLIQTLKPDIQNSEIIASLVNSPLLINVVVAMLKITPSFELINDLEIDASSLSSLSTKNQFDIVMEAACKHLNDNTKMASYLFSLFPGSFDKNVASFQGFGFFHKEIDILLERSLLKKYTSVHGQVFQERYKFPKSIQKYFKNKILTDESLKKTLEGIFIKIFVKYYLDLFYRQLISMKSISEPSQGEQLFLITEQHNLRHLTMLIATEKNLENSFEEDVVTVYSFTHRLLPNNLSTSIISRVLTSSSEKNRVLKLICSLTDLNVCKTFLADFLLSAAINPDTDYAHLPCNVWDIVSAPDNLDFISDSLVQLLLNKSYVYCSFNDTTYIVAKLCLFVTFLCLWSHCFVKYSDIMEAIGIKKDVQDGHVLVYVFVFPVLQYLMQYLLVFYLILLCYISGSLYFFNRWYLLRNNYHLNLFLVVFFFCMFYCNNWMWSLLDNTAFYFSLEGSGSMWFKRWCLLCVHFTHFSILRFLNNFICFAFVPGIPIYILFSCFSVFENNIIKRVSQFVEKNYR